MGIPQTSYVRSFGGPFAGMLHGAGERQVESLLNDAGVDLVPGIGVALKSEGKFEKVDASGDKLLGILVSSFARAEESVTGSASIKNGASANVLTDGMIWVVVEEAVAAGDPVYCRYASGAGGTVLGAFRNDADTASASLVKGAEFVQGSTGAGAALVRFSRTAAIS